MVHIIVHKVGRNPAQSNRINFYIYVDPINDSLIHGQKCYPNTWFTIS